MGSPAGNEDIHLGARYSVHRVSSFGFGALGVQHLLCWLTEDPGCSRNPHISWELAIANGLAAWGFHLYNHTGVRSRHEPEHDRNKLSNKQ